MFAQWAGQQFRCRQRFDHSAILRAALWCDFERKFHGWKYSIHIVKGQDQHYNKRNITNIMPQQGGRINMHIVTVDEMRELEARAEREYGLTSPILMENAGKSAAEIIARLVVGEQGSLEQRTFLLLIGPGNNGGDGLVVARYLEQWGAHVNLYHWKEQRLTIHGHEIA